MGTGKPHIPIAGPTTRDRLPYFILGGAFLGALMLLNMGLGQEKPVLFTLLALAAPTGAALLFFDAFSLIVIGMAILPWAIFINVTDTLPVISFYAFSVLAAVKLLARGKRLLLSPTLLMFTGFGVFLLASSLLMGNIDETKSKLFHWFNFSLFFFVAYNLCDSLERARRLLTILIGSMLANALFSIAMYYIANFAFPTPSQFVDSVLFKVGKIVYGGRGFDLILNGTNWFTEGGNLKALGLFHNPTQASLFALSAFGLSAFLLLDKRTLVSKVLLRANLAASLAHLILCSGRSGMAAMPLLLLVWLYALVKVNGLRVSPRSILIAVLFGGLISIFLGNVLIMNFNSLFSLDYYSNAGRLVAMTSGLTVASHAGAFGFGFGTTPTVMDMGQATTYVQQQIVALIGSVSYSFKSILADEYYRQTNYHSLYVDLVVQTGYIGFTLFLAVFLKLGVMSRGGYSALRYACFALIAAFVLSQAVGGDIFYPKVMIPLLLISALTERMNSKEFEKPESHVGILESRKQSQRL
ncbi:MAG: hypothetical protein ABIW76_09830 [Fibrobacteria bacterium]